MLALTVAVLAVDDPRLVGVEPQPDLCHPRGDPAQHVSACEPRPAVHDRVVGVALERAVREVPDHPGIERVVHEQVREDRRDRRPLRSSLISLNRVPSGCCSGAASHRLTYSSTQRQSVTACTARAMSSHGTSSKNFWTSRSITQSYSQHRCRHVASASWADLFGR